MQLWVTTFHETKEIFTSVTCGRIACDLVAHWGLLFCFFQNMQNSPTILKFKTMWSMFSSSSRWYRHCHLWHGNAVICDLFKSQPCLRPMAVGIGSIRPLQEQSDINDNWLTDWLILSCLYTSSGCKVGAPHSKTLPAFRQPPPGLLLPRLCHHPPQRVPQPQVKRSFTFTGSDAPSHQFIKCFSTRLSGFQASRSQPHSGMLQEYDSRIWPNPHKLTSSECLCSLAVREKVDLWIVLVHNLLRNSPLYSNYFFI